MIAYKWLQTWAFRRHLIAIVLLSVAVPSLLAGLNVYASPKLVAPPQFPATFYGHVAVNGMSVSEGTIITAGGAGVVYVRGTVSALSTYTLNVPADDPATPEREGGQTEEVIEFTIGGLLADQTVVWQGGTSTMRDLSASGVLPTLPTPTATATLTDTPTPTLTDTPVATLTETPSDTPAPTGTPTATRTATPAHRFVYVPLIQKQR